MKSFEKGGPRSRKNGGTGKSVFWELRLLSLGLSLSLLLCVVSGLSAQERQVPNLDGSILEVPENVERVAVLFGPAYEKVFVLGFESAIVADGDFHISGWPWSNIIYKRLNKIPGIPNAHSQLNLEELLKYDPQVVFHFPKPKDIAAMKTVGICGVPAVFSNTLNSTKEGLELYAQVLGGNAPKIAADYSRYFDEKVAYISKRTQTLKASQKPRVYFANQNFNWTAGKDSDIPALIDLAGGICVSAQLPGSSKTEVSYEQLSAWNPQFAFVDHAGSSGNASAEEVLMKSLADPRYEGILAVRDKKVFIVPTGVFFWDSGVQKILMLQWMAKLLHPDLFADLDMNKELKNFYSRFFHYELSDMQAKRILAHLDP